MPEAILIIDDMQSPLRLAEQSVGQRLHHSMTTVHSGREALRWLGSDMQPQPQLILCNHTAADGDGLNLIQKIKLLKPEVPFISVTAYGDDAYGMRALAAGADEFLARPMTMERFTFSVQRCLTVQRMRNYVRWLERKMAGHVDFSDLVGGSEAFQESLALARASANSQAPVWLEGEPGTGKETLARAIHGGGERVGKPFIVVDCKALPEHLDEGMLFGRDRAAPGEARQFALGKIREADQGTLLLKEIGALRPEMQLRLLALLDNGMVIPPGGTQGVPASVRVMCTTSEPVEQLITKGLFNPILFRRLKSLSIPLIPLRQRKEDIELLAEHFLYMYTASENKYIRGLSEPALRWLINYSWPGNVKQLAHSMWRGVVVCERDMLGIADVQPPQRSVPLNGLASTEAAIQAEAQPFIDREGQVKKLKSIEEEAIRFALNYNGGCMTRAARSLGIGRSTLYRKVGELHMENYISRANQTTRPTMTLSSSNRS